MSRIHRHWIAYVIAAVIIALALGLRAIVARYTGGLPTYLALLPAVMLIAMYGGGGPGIWATVLAAAGTAVWILEPRGSWRIVRLQDAVGLAIFMVVGVVISVAAEMRYQSRQRWVEEGAARQQRTIEELARRQTLLEALCEQSGEAIFIKDREGRLVLANPVVATHLGVPLERLIGRRAEEFLDDPALLELSIAMDRRVMESGQGEEIEEVLLTPDGSRTFHTSKAPWRDKDGAILGVIGIASDITEARLQRQALVAAHAITRALLDNARDTMGIIDSDGRILECNQAMADRLGRPVESLPGTVLFDYFLPPELAQARRDMLRRVVGTGQTVEHEDTRAGRDYYSSLRPLFKADGTVWAVAIYSSDITERKRASDMLVQQQIRLRRLALELSLTQARERRNLAVYLHDSVGQDLAAARLQLQMLNATPLAPEGRGLLARTADLLSHAIERTRSLTLELSPPVLFELGLGAAVERLVEDMQANYGLKINFAVSGEQRMLPEGPRFLVFRAIRELLVNITKHAQAQHISITLDYGKDRVAVCVVDDGVGFSGAATANPGGFGLFSIREQFESLGGTLEIRSQPRQGASICLTLPDDFPTRSKEQG